jgi:UDP-2,3-diacylglucosamine hydrolase
LPFFGQRCCKIEASQAIAPKKRPEKISKRGSQVSTGYVCPDRAGARPYEATPYPEPYPDLGTKFEDRKTCCLEVHSKLHISPMAGQSALGIIAGSGSYPFLVARSARQRGVSSIHIAAFENETLPELADHADSIEWMHVGQLGRLLRFFEKAGVREAIMAGQIAPKNLFDLRPDIQVLMVLSRLKRRNAETLFGALGDELAKAGVQLLPATTYMEDLLAVEGVIGGPKPKKRYLDDVAFGFEIAKEVSRLDIGQTVVVRSGTVLAVEGFEGTNETIRRGASLGKQGTVVVKVSKPNQDLRFDVPVIGCETLEVAHAAGVKVIAVEAGKTLLLDRDALKALAEEKRITVYGYKT